jgi:sulfatase maturation enzyme AslB (radical SAM superfamily)
LEGICGDCLHRDFCLGECVANNYYETGKINSSYHFCTQADKAGLFPETRRKKS